MISVTFVRVTQMLCDCASDRVPAIYLLTENEKEREGGYCAHFWFVVTNFIVVEYSLVHIIPDADTACCEQCCFSYHAVIPAPRPQKHQF